VGAIVPQTQNRRKEPSPDRAIPSRSLRNGAAAAQAAQGDVPGERDALSLLPAEVAVVDERARRALRAAVPRVLQRQAQHQRRPGAHPNPRRHQEYQVPILFIYAYFFFLWLMMG
jgi:hypothetical protein